MAPWAAPATPRGSSKARPPSPASSTFSSSSRLMRHTASSFNSAVASKAASKQPAPKLLPRRSSSNAPLGPPTPGTARPASPSLSGLKAARETRQNVGPTQSISASSTSNSTSSTSNSAKVPIPPMDPLLLPPAAKGIPLSGSLRRTYEMPAEPLLAGGLTSASLFSSAKAQAPCGSANNCSNSTATLGRSGSGRGLASPLKRSSAEARSASPSFSECRAPLPKTGEARSSSLRFAEARLSTPKAAESKTFESRSSSLRFAEARLSTPKAAESKTLESRSSSLRFSEARLSTPKVSESMRTTSMRFSEAQVQAQTQAQPPARSASLRFFEGRVATPRFGDAHSSGPRVATPQRSVSLRPSTPTKEPNGPLGPPHKVSYEKLWNKGGVSPGSSAPPVPVRSASASKYKSAESRPNSGGSRSSAVHPSETRSAAEHRAGSRGEARGADVGSDDGRGRRAPTDTCSDHSPPEHGKSRHGEDAGGAPRSCQSWQQGTGAEDIPNMQHTATAEAIQSKAGAKAAAMMEMARTVVMLRARAQAQESSVAAAAAAAAAAARQGKAGGAQEPPEAGVPRSTVKSVRQSRAPGAGGTPAEGPSKVAKAGGAPVEELPTSSLPHYEPVLEQVGEDEGEDPGPGSNQEASAGDESGQLGMPPGWDLPEQAASKKERGQEEGAPLNLESAPSYATVDSMRGFEHSADEDLDSDLEEYDGAPQQSAAVVLPSGSLVCLVAPGGRRVAAVESNGRWELGSAKVSSTSGALSGLPTPAPGDEGAVFGPGKSWGVQCGGLECVFVLVALGGGKVGVRSLAADGRCLSASDSTDSPHYFGGWYFQDCEQWLVLRAVRSAGPTNLSSPDAPALDAASVGACSSVSGATPIPLHTTPSSSSSSSNQTNSSRGRHSGVHSAVAATVAVDGSAWDEAAGGVREGDVVLQSCAIPSARLHIRMQGLVLQTTGAWKKMQIEAEVAPSLRSQVRRLREEVRRHRRAQRSHRFLQPKPGPEAMEGRGAQKEEAAKKGGREGLKDDGKHGLHPDARSQKSWSSKSSSSDLHEMETEVMMQRRKVEEERKRLQARMESLMKLEQEIVQGLQKPVFSARV